MYTRNCYFTKCNCTVSNNAFCLSSEVFYSLLLNVDSQLQLDDNHPPSHLGSSRVHIQMTASHNSTDRKTLFSETNFLFISSNLSMATVKNMPLTKVASYNRKETTPSKQNTIIDCSHILSLIIYLCKIESQTKNLI